MVISPEQTQLDSLRDGTSYSNDRHSRDDILIQPATLQSHDSNEQTLPNLKWSEDPENPFNWSIWKKRVVTLVALLATLTTLIDGTIITAAHEEINHEFGVSDAKFPNSYWPVTTWALGGALGSLIILPLMEDFGVRAGFLWSYFVFFCFVIPTAVANSFATLCITRFFVGACVSVLANTSAGVVSNIWEGDLARTLPTSLYVACYLSGSSLGPVVGGAIVGSLDWRWIGYIQLIIYGSLFPIYWWFFPESRGDVILEKRLRNSRQASSAGRLEKLREMNLLPKLRHSISRPLYMLVTEPVVFFITLWSAFTVGMVYMATQSVEQVFVELYDWSIPQACYVQSAIVLGQICGWSTVFLSRKIYANTASHNKAQPGIRVPEGRLYVSIFGSFVGLSGGLFVYAWTSYSYLPWIAPAIGIFFMGCGTTIVLTALTDYVIDAYSLYAGSVIAAVILGENLFAAFLPLAASSMYNTLGFNWASTLLAFIALALSFIPVTMVIWGKKIRARSKFMSQAIVSKDGADVLEKHGEATV